MPKGAKSICLAFLSLLIPGPGLLAQGAPLRVDGERIKSYIEYLSTDEMKGRQSMTPEYQAAAEWVAAQYKAWGLEPAGDNGTYLQRVPINRGLTRYEGIPELRINGEDFSLVEGDFSVQSASSTICGPVQGEVVFVGYGISAPAKGLDEYAGVDVRGKVALVLTGSPATAPRAASGGSMAPGPRPEAEPTEEWTLEATDLAKIRTAYDKGASAVLLYNPDAATQSGFGGGARRAAPDDDFAPTRDFLAFSITDRAFRALMKPDFQESVRGFTTRLNQMREEIRYGTPQSAATGARVQLKGYDRTDVYSEELGNNFAYNVVAKLPGTDPALRDQFVVMGGHLDHLGMRDGQVSNGADDNASGTAVAMEVARVLREAGFQPKRTIVFAAWTGEELGLIGSNHFVANPPSGIDIDKVVTYFNMDMVGLGDAIGAPGALNFPTIWDVIRRDQDPDVISAVRPRTGGPGGSDHSAFITRGIEALALMTAGGVGHPYYHRPEDDTEKIDPEILRKTGQFVLQGTVNLANEEEVRLLIPDRENLYNAMQFSVTAFTPGQGDYQGVRLGARTREDLLTTVLDSALAVTAALQEQQRSAVQAPASARGAAGGRAPARTSFNRGIGDLSVFEGDLRLLLAAAEFVGFGRLDVQREDGRWFAGGHVTAEGREAVRELEANDVWIHLASPSQTLFEDLLSTAAEPFIVTGRYSVTPSMASAINEKGVVLGVAVDPANMTAALDELDRMKRLLGDTDNLVLCPSGGALTDEAETALYMGLMERGWTTTEIAGDRRAGGGISGGNLRVFSAAAGRMMPMR